MMLALAMLLQQVPVEESERLVEARRAFSRFRAVTVMDRKSGSLTCKVKRGTGSPERDAAYCSIVLACAPKVTTTDEMIACLRTGVDGLAAASPED